MPVKFWTREKLEIVKSELAPTCRTKTDLEKLLLRRFGLSLSVRAMESPFVKEFGLLPTAFFKKATPALVSEAPDVTRLVDFVRKGEAKNLEQVCDALSLCPKDVKSLVEQAVSKGYSLRIRDSHLEFTGLPVSEDPKYVKIPKATNFFRFAVISDTHLGSHYCREEELKDFINTAYDEYGVRHVLHSGDVLDGHKIYRGHELEVAQVGFEAQAERAVEVFPERDGLTYDFIVGNHDLSFHKLSGFDPGKALVSRFTEAGRDDWRYLGPEHAQVMIGPDPEAGKAFVVELHHPDGGSAYAVSYRLQRAAAAIQPGTKPDILVQGHFHRYVNFEERDIFCMHPGAFQAQTPFLRRKYVNSALGGTIVEVALTDDYVVRKIRCTWFPYRVSYMPRRPIDMDDFEEPRP